MKVGGTELLPNSSIGLGGKLQWRFSPMAENVGERLAGRIMKTCFLTLQDPRAKRVLIPSMLLLGNGFLSL